MRKQYALRLRHPGVLRKLSCPVTPDSPGKFHAAPDERDAVNCLGRLFKLSRLLARETILLQPYTPSEQSRVLSNIRTPRL